MSDLENLVSYEDLQAPIDTRFNITEGELENEQPEGEETQEVVDVSEIEEATRIIERLENGEEDVDTDQIRKLTPDLAGRLVNIAKENERYQLSLNGLTEISEGVAEKLAEFGGSRLYLNGLTEISEGAAEKLAKSVDYGLSLNGITEISEGAAEKLAEFEGNELSLGGITEISEGAAEKLAEFEGDILSLGLREISEGAAEKLAEFGGDELYLNGITEISEGVAEKLAEFKCFELSLGLREISEGVAKIIELRKGELSLYGIKEISNNISSDILNTIEKGSGTIDFGGISELNEGLAKVIGLFKGYITLSNIRKINYDINDEIVETMSTCPGSLVMPGISELDEGLAKVISSFQGHLYVDYISIDGYISDKTMELMSTCPGHIHMNTISEMNNNLSKIINKFQGHLHLEGIKNSKGISDEEMANIVKCPGYLYLGIDNIDKEFGTKIVGFEGKGLGLPGVKYIDDETAEVLIPIKDKFIDSKAIVDAITRVEKKIERANQLNQELEQMRQGIKDTEPSENRDGRRQEKIEYNRKEGDIKSWYNGTKVKEISEDGIKLEGLDLELTKEEGMWLANFKNMVKHEFKGREVEYTRGVRNKSFAYRKTLYVGNTVLIKRKKLNEHIPSCEDDEVVEKIKDWLNS